MKQKKASKKLERRKSDEFLISQTIHFTFPQSFIQLCKMLEVSPRFLLFYFIDALVNEDNYLEGCQVAAATDFLSSENRIAPFFDEDDRQQCLIDLHGLTKLKTQVYRNMPSKQQKWRELENNFLAVWRDKWSWIKKERKIEYNKRNTLKT
jgi:hypothetical protein